MTSSLARNSSNDEPREEFNAAFDLATQEVHEHIEWHPFGNAGFVNAYCEVKAHILIRFRVRDGQEFLACVQRDWKPLLSEPDDPSRASRKGNGEVLWSQRLLNRHFLWSEVMHRVYGANGQEQSMLVNVVEPVKGPESLVPSLVWLDSVERFERLLLNAVYDLPQGGFVGLGGMSDGELSVFGDDGNYPTSEVIESAAKTVQDIASDKRYMTGDGWDFSDVIREFSGLRVYLSERRNGVRIVKDAQSGIQLVEVLFGPIQFV